jgi:hypothetical protein
MRSIIRHKFFILFIILIFNTAFCANLFASQEAFISDVHLTNTRDNLIAYFKVENAFTEEISNAVLKGIPASFSFYITLDQINKALFNSEISDLKITSTLKYDILKKEFIVSRPWKNGKPFVTESFEEAKAAMTEINNFNIADLRNLVKGKDYKLKLKADLDKVTLPLYLHYIFFFVSFWDFETDKHITRFTY